MPYVTEPPQLIRVDAASRPEFIVGQSPEGWWLAVETHGRGGGIFRDRDSAIAYVAEETGSMPGSVAIATAPVALKM
ncbi:RAG2 PHD domain containing protein [Methylopila henanensis]|uniref:RAG2 PHD domain containing protein n=1 Tax=Methylopila henanensis TaxID=873516 RepID=A0ABW4K916_9HYPH